VRRGDVMSRDFLTKPVGWTGSAVGGAFIGVMAWYFIFGRAPDPNRTWTFVFVSLIVLITVNAVVFALLGWQDRSKNRRQNNSDPTK
jgi:hypothetical protein